MDWITAVALAGLIVGLFAWLRADMGTLRSEMGKQGEGLRGEIAKQGDEIAVLAREVGKLRERMARMEGLLEGLREAVASRHAA